VNGEVLISHLSIFFEYLRVNLQRDRLCFSKE
jgi:hypothetical protein